MRTAQKMVTVASAGMVAMLTIALVGCTGEAGPENPPVTSHSDPGSHSDAPGDGAGDAATPRGADLATTSFAVSWRDAVDAAMANFDGKLAEIGLDWSRDRYAYEIELVSATEEHKVRIDADTGEQLRERTEAIESDDLAEKQAEVVDLDAIIPWDEALATALDAQNGTVNEWKLEGTKHGPQYEFDIDTDSGEDYEVSIDARTGELLAVDD